MLKKLIEKGYPFTIVRINEKGEVTNNLLEPAKILNNTIVCSPKMGSASCYNEKQFDEVVLARIDYLKFVVEAPSSNEKTLYSNLPKYVEEFKKYHPSNRIYVSGINVYKRPTSIAEGEAPCLFDSVEGVGNYDSEKGPLYDLKQCYENYKYAAKIALENGYRLNFQLHLLYGLF